MPDASDSFFLKDNKSYYKLQIPEIKSSISSTNLQMDSNLNIKSGSSSNHTDGEKYQGETRKKVQLGKGYSLMDWIKKTRDTVDLAGTHGILRAVTYDELIKHDKIDDCWMVIYGNNLLIFSSSVFFIY